MAKQRHLSEKDVWRTPQWLIDGIEKYKNISLDPCAGAETEIGDINYRLEDGDDGLQEEWFGTVFVNPPFTQKNEWLSKALDERENTDLIMFLTPDSTDVQSWWHGKIVPNADYVWFSYGRMNYIDPDKGEVDNTQKPTFGTAISMYGDVPDELLQFFDEEGWVVETANF